MIKNKKIAAVLSFLTFLVFFGVTFFFLNKTSEKKNEVPAFPTENIQPTSPTSSQSNSAAVLDINGVKYEDEVARGTNVYDFMSKLRKEGKINFTEKNYTGMGEFIVSINGVTGNKQKGWIYYVNGKEAGIGISNYKINPGDVVSWKYEKSNY